MRRKGLKMSQQFFLEVNTMHSGTKYSLTKKSQGEKEEHTMQNDTKWWSSTVVVLAAVLALIVAPTTGSAQSFTIISPNTAEAQT